MSDPRDNSYRWVFYLATGFLYAGAVLRSPLVIEDQATLTIALALLAAWLVLLVSEPALSRRWRPWFIVYLVVQSGLVVALLSLPGDYDFFALLFGILSMQAMERLGARGGAICIGAFVPLTAVPLLAGTEPADAAAFVLIYTILDVFLGAYVLTTRRATAAAAGNHALAGELAQTNRELREYSARAEKLTVARERNRVARELHDSVTQTVFSMNLSSQSAILLQNQPERLTQQLERIADLTQSALAEMHTLILELAPDAEAEDDLPAALRRDIERRAADGVTVSLATDGPPVSSGRPFSPGEQQAHLRTAPEGLNNVVKHAGTAQAHIRLRLWDPPRMEIEDRGRGFASRPAGAAGQANGAGRAGVAGGMGIQGMRERAAEVGWRLDIESTPGEGTRVRVERGTAEGSDT
jgi:signal transduction histidine kinase